MKIYTEIVIDIESGKVQSEKSFEYSGPVSQCGGGSGGGGGDSTVTQRYADYIEGYQKSTLTMMASQRDNVTEAPPNWYAIDSEGNPTSKYEHISADEGFMGQEGRSLTHYTALFDLYDEYIVGMKYDTLNILWNTIFSETVDNSYIGTLVKAESDLLEDEITENVIPRFEEGMRDINAVLSSTFVIGKSVIENARIKSVAKFDAELRYRLIPVAEERWQQTLNWQHSVVGSFADLLKLYYATKIDTVNMTMDVTAKERLWPFTIHEYERAMLGAMEGAITTTKSIAGESGTAKALSGALSGAAFGTLIGHEIPKLAMGGLSSSAVGGIGGAILGIGSALL